MKWFNNLKIKVKLISCFIVLAIFTGIVGFIGITNMGNINARADDMYLNNFLPSQNLTQIQKSLLIIRSDYLLMLYEKNGSKLEERLKEIDSLAETNDRIIADYEKNIKDENEKGKNEKAATDALKASLQEYRKIRGEHIAMVQAGNFEEASTRIAEFTKAREQVDKDIEVLIDLNAKIAQEKSQQNTSDYRSQSTVMLAIIVAGVVLAIGMGLFIANLISKPLNQLVKVADKMADGDLDVAVSIDARDEVGILAQAFRKMAENINDVMTNISSAAEQVAAGSKQVSDSSMALSQGATEQASSVEQLTASLEEISAQTRQNAESADEANSIAEEAKANAMQGNSQMKGMLKAMDEINDSSANISRIIKVIDEIAFQTNILALNAAVEAARAGQHGKGFAVVAEEVRNLAARSANAAKETTEMIEGSIKKVDGGTKIANQTADALNKIVEGVAKVANLVGNIAVASNEQASGIGQVNQGIIQVSQVVQNNSATSEESAAASEELSSQAELLKEQVARFKLKKVQRVNSSYRGLEDINPEVMRMLDKISERKSGGHGGFEAGAHPPKGAVPAAGHNRIMLSDREFGKY